MRKNEMRHKIISKIKTRYKKMMKNNMRYKAKRKKKTRHA